MDSYIYHFRRRMFPLPGQKDILIEKQASRNLKKKKRYAFTVCFLEVPLFTFLSSPCRDFAVQSVLFHNAYRALCASFTPQGHGRTWALKKYI